MDVVTLKPNMRQVIESFLDTGVGDKIYHSIEGSGVTENEIVECQRNICVTHRGMYTSRQGGGAYWYWHQKYFQALHMLKYPCCPGKYLGCGFTLGI